MLASNPVRQFTNFNKSFVGDKNTLFCTCTFTISSCQFESKIPMHFESI